MKEILDYIIRNKSRLCVTKENQLLLYIEEERGVRKSCVIYVLEMDFILLDRKNQLMLSAPTRCAAEDKIGSTVHITLSISTYKVKS